MQIMPETAEFLAKRSGAKTFQVSDLSTPQVNIAYGSYLLRYLLDQYHGNLVFALAAYNGGETNVDRWVAQARKSGHKLTIARIPFPETRAYVQKVLRAERDYRHEVRQPARLSVGAPGARGVLGRGDHLGDRRRLVLVQRGGGDADPRRRPEPEPLAGHHQPAGVEQRRARPVPPRSPGPTRSGPSAVGGDAALLQRPISAPRRAA